MDEIKDGVILLISAVLNLVRAVINVPADWNDESQVVQWLHGMEESLAKVIVILVPEALPQGDRDATLSRLTAEFIAEVRARFLGCNPTGDSDLDWSTIIDWVVTILVQWFPDRAALIQFVAAILKQLLQLFLNPQGVDPLVAKTFA